LSGEGPPEAMKTSTHALSLTEWLRLGALLGNTPPEVVVYGITGSDFRPGAPLSDEVRRGAEECAVQIEGYLRARGQARDA
jgi:hydrogenase maturation protease